MRNKISSPFLSRQRWTNRGYLPHFQGSAIQFVTYRLADSLPQGFFRKLNSELEKVPAENRDLAEYRAVETNLDQGYGSCVLRQEDCARTVIENWEHFDGDRYEPLGWVVMPNHAHILIRLFPGWELSTVVHSWKSYTAKQIVGHVGQGFFHQNRVWQREYFDRFIRDEEHFERVLHYILSNPVKAGLVDYPNWMSWGFRDQVQRDAS